MLHFIILHTERKKKIERKLDRSEENERESKTESKTHFKAKGEGDETGSLEAEMDSAKEAAVSGFTDGIASEGTPYRIAIATGTGSTSGISASKGTIAASQCN